MERIGIESGQPGRVISRRRLFGLAGCAGAGALAAPLGREAPMRLPASLACVARPAQTEGPYFVDDMLERADLRGDPTDGTSRPGVPVSLRFVVHRVGAQSCTPLAGAQVDVWQCDADGLYSDVVDERNRFDTRGKAFLRGWQRTGLDGAVEFTTIYPGFYTGRTPHIHFKVRILEREEETSEFTSQLYFDDSLSDRIYSQSPYRERDGRRTRNEQDGIFRGGGTGTQLMMPLTERGEGWAGTFEMGLMV